MKVTRQHVNDAIIAVLEFPLFFLFGLSASKMWNAGLHGLVFLMVIAVSLFCAARALRLYRRRGIPSPPK